MAFDLNEVANRLYACRQRFSIILFSRFLAEFYGNLPLSNSQQGYSLRGGEGEKRHKCGDTPNV